MDAQVSSLPADDLGRAKRAYTTHIADLTRARTLISGGIRPRAGDLVLARVVEIEQHERIELPNGRRAQLYVDDVIVVTYGNRYAPDQYEAEVPDDLGSCHLVASGGIAARVLSQHCEMLDPTRIAPVGLLGDGTGRPLNLRDFAPPALATIGPRPTTLVSVGTSMNAGKTTTLANLIRGYTLAGKRVGAAKVTGTGAGKDPMLMLDAGATEVLDFTDAGYPSTYLVPMDEIMDIAERLTARLVAADVDLMVLEVADGVFQRETAALLVSPRFRASIDGVIFSAGDAAGATMGTAWLRSHDLPVIGVSGLLTASPLATREARASLDLPVWDAEAMCAPGIVAEIERALAPATASLAVAAR